MSDCEVTLFDKIVARTIPATIVYEDDTCLAFKDINPQAPVHLILIPKNRDGLSQLSKADEKHAVLLGKLMLAASKITAAEPQLQNGFRLVINDGVQGCQSVYHFHIHILGGTQLTWPPGTPGPGGEGPAKI